MLRNPIFLSWVTLVALVILSLWVWSWSPILAKALALTFACSVLAYLYVARLVAPLIRTRRWQYSLFDLCLLVLAFILLAANRRSPDGLVALGLWPWTVILFRVRPVDGPGVSARRTLFWAHSTYLVLAMVFSLLFSHWLASQWPIHYDRAVEPPICLLLVWPAILVMMHLQQDLAVKLLHPSLLSGILVLIGTAVLIATLTSWVISALAVEPCQPR
jgi:hypothetical protein